MTDLTINTLYENNLSLEGSTRIDFTKTVKLYISSHLFGYRDCKEQMSVQLPYIESFIKESAAIISE